MGKRIYSEEFKLEALRLLRERGVSLSQVARELGIKQQTLHRWREQHEEGKRATGSAAALPQRSSSQELERLRRENVRLRAERDILKKALGYFAKEPK